MEKFLKNLENSLNTHFSGYRIEYLIQSLQSLKAKIHLEGDYFIAVRYNARNGRTDVALVSNNQRIFGYDNLKKWHFHPYENPSMHVFCEPPSMKKVISDTKKYYEMDMQKSTKNTANGLSKNVAPKRSRNP
jgi:hypothetical protein